MREMKRHFTMILIYILRVQTSFVPFFHHFNSFILFHFINIRLKIFINKLKNVNKKRISNQSFYESVNKISTTK